MSKNKENLRRDVTLANKDLKDIAEAVELVGGIHLDMTLSFGLGVLNKILSLAKETYDDLTKVNFREFAIIKKDQKTGEDKQFIPLKKMVEFEGKQKVLDNLEFIYSIPTFVLSDFTGDSSDEDDPKNKIPSGFVTRIMSVLSEYKDVAIKKPTAVTTK
jgi:hypothetical protein